MDVDGILHVRVDVDRPAGLEVPAALLHLERVQPLVGRAVARAQREQPLGLELCRLHRARGGAVGTILQPRDAIFQVIGESCFCRAAVHLAQDAAPEPLPEPLL